MSDNEIILCLAVIALYLGVALLAFWMAIRQRRLPKEQ